MRRLLLLSALAATVFTQYYKPVSAPASRRRHLGPITVTDREECQRACDCARGDSTVCSSFNPPIPPSDCQAYFYQGGGCALLGEAGVHNTCSRNKTEYVLIPDPCTNVSCLHGECLVSEDLTAHCEYLRFLDGACLQKLNGNLDRYNNSLDRAWNGMRNKFKQSFYASFKVYTNIFVPENYAPGNNASDCYAACSENPAQTCGKGAYGWLYEYPETPYVSVSASCGNATCNGHGSCRAFDESIRYCECDKGYQGRGCEELVGGEPNACEPSPCLNDGLCLRRAKGFRCLCKEKFGGRNCDPIS